VEARTPSRAGAAPRSSTARAARPLDPEITLKRHRAEIARTVGVASEHHDWKAAGDVRESG
jgi:hypothetical protein